MSRTRICSSASALACLATTLVIGCQTVRAAVDTSSTFFGVTSASSPSTADFQRVARGGVHEVRVFLFWLTVEPQPGVYDWRQLDALVSGAASAGSTVLPVLFGTPLWASAHPADLSAYTPASPPLYTTEGRAGWSTFVRELAGRYGTNGSFWQLHQELPRLPIRSWQLWNEVHTPLDWGGPPSPRGYAKLLRLTRNAMRAADPASKLVLAGMLPYASLVPGNVSGGQFLRRLLKLRGVRGLFDAVAVHPYGARPRDVVGGLKRIRKVLNAVGARRVPIWATEFGWTTGGADLLGSPFRTTLDEQAARVTDTFRLLLKDRKRLRLQRAIYFSFADIPGSESWGAHMGLFTADGSPKPAWYAYTSLAGGQP